MSACRRNTTSCLRQLHRPCRHSFEIPAYFLPWASPCGWLFIRETGRALSHHQSAHPSYFSWRQIDKSAAILRSCTRSGRELGLLAEVYLLTEQRRNLYSRSQAPRLCRCDTYSQLQETHPRRIRLNGKHATITTRLASVLVLKHPSEL